MHGTWKEYENNSMSLLMAKKNWCREEIWGQSDKFYFKFMLFCHKQNIVRKKFWKVYQ